MVVNSLNFLLFFTVVFIVYYLPICRKNTRIRNGWLFLVSYFFYGVADWKMIPLLLSATIVFYALGLWLKREMVKNNEKTASHLTTLGVCLGVGILLYFKYFNFFAESFAELLSAIGLNVTWTTLNIVLPIGVSFFTFKLISYIIEIHREHIEPSKDFIEFGTYIAFFPTILSGPIDKPNKFIPQLGGTKTFNYDLAVDGCRQILWGMFTKMCIADNLATVTDSVWISYTEQSGSTLVLVALLYLIQIYADFDGYSNMAIGVGKLLGIHVTRNFKHPLLARNIAEYWRNWHMSLTGWLTEYVFSPLNISFRNLGNTGIVLAIVINFVIIGLWHGANWTFAVFGLYHGLLYVPLVYSGAFGKNKKLKPNTYGLPKLDDFLKMIETFILVSLGLIIFRASNVGEAVGYFEGLFSLSFFSIPSLDINVIKLTIIIVFVIFLIIAEWKGRNEEYSFMYILRYSFFSQSYYSRIILYVMMFVMINLFKGNQSDFIYFKF